MAIEIKTDKTFTPTSFNGIDNTGDQFYAVIDGIDYDKKNKFAQFSLNIYCDKDARECDLAFADYKHFTFNGAEFDDKIGSNGLSISQAYTIALETLTDWESDE